MSAKAHFRLLDFVGLPVLVEDKPHPLDENIRRVERGSRIVVAVTQDTKVILQDTTHFLKIFNLSIVTSIKINFLLILD